MIRFVDVLSDEKSKSAKAKAEKPSIEAAQPKAKAAPRARKTPASSAKK